MRPMKLKLSSSKLYIYLSFFLFILSLQTLAQEVHKLEARVIDFDTQQPLQGVSVIVREKKQGSITNDTAVNTSLLCHFCKMWRITSYKIAAE